MCLQKLKFSKHSSNIYFAQWCHSPLKSGSVYWGNSISLLQKCSVLQKRVGKGGVCLLQVMKTGDWKLVCLIMLVATPWRAITLITWLFGKRHLPKETIQAYLSWVSSPVRVLCCWRAPLKDHRSSYWRTGGVGGGLIAVHTDKPLSPKHQAHFTFNGEDSSSFQRFHN